MALSPEVKDALSAQMRGWLGFDLMTNLPKSFLIEVGIYGLSTAVGTAATV